MLMNTQGSAPLRGELGWTGVSATLSHVETSHNETGEVGIAELAPHSRHLSAWALETSGCTVLLLDARIPDLPVVQIGPGFEQLTGHGRDEYLGREYDFLQGPATDVRALDQIHKATRGGAPCRVVLRSYRKDGVPFWNEVTIAPLAGARGEIVAVRVLQSDVTQRVEALGQLELVSTLLAHRQQFTSAVLEGIHAAIITADARGRVTFINRLACKTLRLTPGQCKDADLIHLLDLPPDVFSGLTEGAHVKRMSHVVRRADGQNMDLGISMSRAFGDAHHDLGYFIVFRDLSDKLRFELDLRRVERLAAMGTMVAGFAHEVRNPVATLRILAESMQADARPSDPSMEYLSRMMLQIERIERLVKTSLQFGRPVAPRRSVHCAESIAKSALETTALRLKSAAPRIDIEARLPPVLADDAQIAQVLVILLENAHDAAGSIDRVAMRVCADENGSHVRFEITDCGPGISESMMSRIFDPFFTTKPHGTGLGLSIAQQLIHENGGRIEASSIEGKGTTFAVLVPRAEQQSR